MNIQLPGKLEANTLLSTHFLPQSNKEFASELQKLEYDKQDDTCILLKQYL